MRRSARLKSQPTHLVGAVKRRAESEPPHPSPLDKSIIASSSRRRGLFQEHISEDAPDTEPEFVVHSDAVITSPQARSVPPSPFQAIAEDLSLQHPPFSDENTPPRKRRNTIAQDAELPETGHQQEELASLLPQDHETTHPEDQNGNSALPTWFTPIRPARPPTDSTMATPASGGMPARMPSFAQWIEKGEPSDAAPVAAFASPPAAPKPPASTTATAGVDMTDLARLYDPLMAAAMGKSPPTPVEKLYSQNATAREHQADEDIHHD